MEPNKVTVLEQEAVEQQPGENGAAPVPNPHGARLMELIKAIDEAGVPKLTLEEIEEYLGRKLGGIAEVFPDGVIPHSGTVQQIILETPAETFETVAEQDSEMCWPEPQTELGRDLLALAKEIDKSGLPKLTLEEIEEYLGRKLGGIAEAYPEGVIPRTRPAQPQQG